MRAFLACQGEAPLPQDDDTTQEYCGAYALPVMGRAPHAAVVEYGLVPDWILPGIRNRGMRPARPAPPRRPSAIAVRAPPRRLWPPISAKAPPPEDADSCPS